jgi:16S rRNA (guanine527-N7)-methyltransferase
VSRLFHVKTERLPAAASRKLDALTERYRLADAQRAQLAALLSLLAADEHAPTAVRDAVRAVDVHIADSLVALDVDEVHAAVAVADIGAGAGFPGLALAVARPPAVVRLVESQARKCRFMERACAFAGIANARVVCSRAEEWAEGVGVNDLVFARAVAAPAVVLEYAAPLLQLGGTLVDWRGRRDRAEERSARDIAGALGMELIEVRRVVPHEEASDHHLYLYRKRCETPAGFPRRAGVARKRPLTG